MIYVFNLLLKERKKRKNIIGAHQKCIMKKVWVYLYYFLKAKLVINPLFLIYYKFISQDKTEEFPSEYFILEWVITIIYLVINHKFNRF